MPDKQETATSNMEDSVQEPVRDAVVALVDWHGSGHNVSFMRLFARALLELGRRVIVLAPDPHACAELAATAPGRLALVEFSRTKSWVFWSRRQRNIANAARTSEYFVRRLAEGEQMLGAACDLVFFNCFYDSQIELITALAGACRCPWSFLYIHSNSLPPHNEKNPAVLQLLRHERLKAFGVLDERTVASGEALSGRRVVRFPDLADTCYEEGHPLELELKRLAGSRPLVLLIGHLFKRKGLFTLLEAAAMPEAKDLFFAFVGEYKMRGKEWRCFRRAVAGLENVCFKPGYLPDELSYNACIRAADVLFAAYIDFPYSSNTLAKAAAFGKPILVSEGHLMADEVRRFRMGEVIPQGDAGAALEAIRRIVSDPDAWQRSRQPDWQGYVERQSFGALKQAFAEILSCSSGKESGEKP